MELKANNFGGLSVIDSEFYSIKGSLKKTDTVVHSHPVVREIDRNEKEANYLHADEGISRCFDENGHRLRLRPTRGHAHGHLGSAEWAAPFMTKYCESEARPGYATTLAHEYQDELHVLDEKVTLLAQMLMQSEACLLYTGAGLSTSAGIGDYASRTTAGDRIQSALKSPMLAEPTFAHYALGDICKRSALIANLLFVVIVSILRRGLIKQWVQQNHDGLPQKAAVPQR